MDLFLWISVTYGIVLVVTWSHIFSGLRKRAYRFNYNLGVLLDCPPCFGWWTSFALTFLHLGPAIGRPLWQACFMNAFSGAGVCWVIRCVTGYLQPHLHEDDEE